MRMKAFWMVVCLALGGMVPGSAHAEGEISTIYLQNGGKLRGEIVMDMPGAPLTVIVAGQAVQVPRESIARIEGASAQVAPAAAPAAAAPVDASGQPVAYAAAAPPPAPAMAPAPAPIDPTAPLVLQFDRRGRALVDSRWSPELQQLVMRRNDVAYSMKRKGLGAPITMLSLGVVGIITTAIATTIVSNNYASCISDSAYDYTYGSCSDRSAVGMGIGYGFSSALLAGGTTFLLVRLLRKKSLKRQLAIIDQDLRRFNVQAMAKLSSPGISVAGLSLRAAF